MDRVKFMIDSGSDIPPSVAEELDTEVVPLYRIIEGKPVLDFHDFDIGAYSEYLKTCKEIPTTSQPSPEDFLIRYERFFEEGYSHIICITMSVYGSGTYNSAVLASQMFAEHHPDAAMQIHVVDSWSCSLNMVLELRAAHRLYTAGAAVHTILEELDRLRRRVQTYYLIDNLEFLIKGGRVSPLKGGIAAKLRIKPVVTIKNGEGSIPAYAMGYQNGLAKLTEYYWNDTDPRMRRYTLPTPAARTKRWPCWTAWSKAIVTCTITSTRCSAPCPPSRAPIPSASSTPAPSDHSIPTTGV